MRLIGKRRVTSPTRIDDVVPPYGQARQAPERPPTREERRQLELAAERAR